MKQLHFCGTPSEAAASRPPLKRRTVEMITPTLFKEGVPVGRGV